MIDSTITIGQSAEKIAWQYLQSQGCRLKDKNFSCKVGEIDLVIQDADYLAFVEVRYRENENFGSGAETVTWHKQRKIIKAAQYYMKQKKINHLTSCRFDVMSITLDKNKQPQIDWIKNAFQL